MEVCVPKDWKEVDKKGFNEFCSLINFHRVWYCGGAEYFEKKLAAERVHFATVLDDGKCFVDPTYLVQDGPVAQ